MKAQLHPESRLRALEQAYRASQYRIQLPEAELVLRIGERSIYLDNYLVQLGCATWAFLSAYNPGSQLLTEKANQIRQKELERQLRQLDYRYYFGVGQAEHGDWPGEQSVWIPGIHQEQALQLARAFGQLAIVWGEWGEKAQLVWCAKNI